MKSIFFRLLLIFFVIALFVNFGRFVLATSVASQGNVSFYTILELFSEVDADASMILDGFSYMLASFFNIVDGFGQVAYAFNLDMGFLAKIAAILESVYNVFTSLVIGIVSISAGLVKVLRAIFYIIGDIFYIINVLFGLDVPIPLHQ